MSEGRRLVWVTLGVVAAMAAGAAPAGAAKEIGANGNFLTGGLSFTPATERVAVGEVVSWRNTDFLVPHTATENHKLWDLGGTYGQTPLNPPGFGPGATVSRAFEAGSQSYYCVVHPQPMQGRIDVPVTLSTTTAKVRVRVKVKLKRKRGQRKPRYRYKRVRRNVKFVVARWAPAPLTGGLVMDVQRRRNNGPWTAYATGTTKAIGDFEAGKRKTLWDVRARLRRGSNATGWSPAVRIIG